MATFSIPTPISRSKLVIDKLLGIDYTSNTANVSTSQSPNEIGRAHV